MIRIPYNQDLIKKVKTIPGKVGICEQFAYLPKIEAYPNCSDMNELGDSEKIRRTQKWKNWF